MRASICFCDTESIQFRFKTFAKIEQNCWLTGNTFFPPDYDFGLSRSVPESAQASASEDTLQWKWEVAHFTGLQQSLWPDNARNITVEVNETRSILDFAIYMPYSWQQKFVVLLVTTAYVRHHSHLFSYHISFSVEAYIKYCCEILPWQILWTK